MRIYQRYVKPALYGAAVFIAVFLATTLFRGTAVDRVVIAGDSMSPAFTDGQTVWVNKTVKTPGRGVPVVIDTGEHYVIKRIIGMPGDTVEIRGGKVYVNGEAEAGDYPETRPDMTVEVGKDRVFVLGDNRGDSDDSRGSLGQVATGDIAGVPLQAD